MKKIESVNRAVYIGMAEEIAPIVKSMYRAFRKGKGYDPIFLNVPKFNPNRFYGIDIDDEGYFIVDGETEVVRILLNK